MLYTIENITKVHGDRIVLDIPCLALEEGLIYALLGPNGAGKTTLMNILAFLDTPTTGKIFYKGEQVPVNQSGLLGVRRKVVMLDQHPILFTGTVYQNIEFGLKIRKIPKKERERIIGETLELVGMSSFAHGSATGLSGGETQRVALARVLAVSPDVLLCDEPTSSVDLENQDVIINIIRRINREKGITVVFTNHDRLQATSLAHKTLLLDHGKLTDAAHGNLFAAQLSEAGEGGTRCRINGSVSFTLPITGRNGRARILIDPEKISLAKESGKNGFRGRIVRMAAEKEMVRMDIDTGVHITALIPLQQYMDGELRIGDEVRMDLGPEAVRIIRS